MTAYYNENDPYAAQWLRNLIAAGHIAPGVVDERSIREVSADDLKEFRQCHFFAGIGVWSYALRRAGWSDEREVWTGSCPCQPFSAAGKQRGFDDERHLWPVWFDLIRKRRPPVVVGEQVAGALDWLDLVSADLEGADYAFAASDLCAAGFGGAHIRQRLYFVAHADDARPQGRARVSERADQRTARQGGVAVGMAFTGSEGRQQIGSHTGGSGERGGAQGLDKRFSDGGAMRGMADALRGGAEHDTREGVGAQAATNGLDGSVSRERLRARVEDPSCGLGNAGCLTDERRRGTRDLGCAAGEKQGKAWQRERCGDADSGASAGCWPCAPLLGRNPADWLFCRDGKWRPVEPGTFPLADAAPARVGRLRAYGNGLDAETATQFCAATRETLDGL